MEESDGVLESGGVHESEGVQESTGPSPLAPVIGPGAALERLVAGNRRFVEGALRHPRRDSAHRAALTFVQHPFAAVLGCADSRVPHEILFDEGVGDLFSVRVAGNTADDALVVGSVEFAIVILGVSAVVVLGHEDCGAVKAAVDVVTRGAELAGDLPAVVQPIVPVVEALVGTVPDDELVAACTRANVARAVEQLERVPLVAEAVAAGRLVVEGREYHLSTGEAAPIG